MINYHKACGYAWKLTKQDYRDLVHSAYLKYYDKTGGNLFDLPNRTIITWIKNGWYDALKRNTFMVNGETHTRTFTSFDDPEKDIENLAPMSFNFGGDNFDLNVLKSELSSRQIEVLTQLIEGYTVIDIGKKEGRNQSSIRKIKNTIKNKLEVWYKK